MVLVGQFYTISTQFSPQNILNLRLNRVESQISSKIFLIQVQYLSWKSSKNLTFNIFLNFFSFLSFREICRKKMSLRIERRKKKMEKVFHFLFSCILCTLKGLRHSRERIKGEKNLNVKKTLSQRHPKCCKICRKINWIILKFFHFILILLMLFFEVVFQQNRWESHKNKSYSLFCNFFSISHVCWPRHKKSHEFLVCRRIKNEVMKSTKYFTLHKR